ncbi:MAG: hypothetical protein WCO84_06745, partial [bacterium]
MNVLDYTITVTPNLAEFGDNIDIFISGIPDTKFYLAINEKYFLVKLDKHGVSTLTIPTSHISFEQSKDKLQVHRVYFSLKKNGVKVDTNQQVKILPESVAKAAVAASSLILNGITIPTTIPATQTKVQYPKAGTSLFSGFQNPETLNSSYTRVNGYSVCKVSDDTALVALSTFDTTTEDNPPKLLRDDQSRVYLISTNIGFSYASNARMGRVTNESVEVDNCIYNVIEIAVDDDIWSDTRLNRLMVLDGDLKGIEFRVLSRVSPNRWLIMGDISSKVITVGQCFFFTAFEHVQANSTSSSREADLTRIQPLPNIKDGDTNLHAINPQIAVSEHISPDGNKYAYVVAEAPVNGVYQLFMFAFAVKNSSTDFLVDGWYQLTYDGENRNPSIAVDRIGNLHIAWESDRCQPAQIMYGTLGPSSRSIANEVFVSAIDKQAHLRVTASKDQYSELLDKSELKRSLTSSLVTIASPTPVDYSIGGTMWNQYKVAPATVTVTNNSTITVAGNPSSARFAALAYVDHDEFGVAFDGKFSQLSYQLSFDLTSTAAAAITAT